ncbi:MAG: VWA domain-containing protein [Blastocatellales bacterium]
MYKSLQARLLITFLLVFGMALPAYPQSGRKTRPREVNPPNSRQTENQNQDKPLADNTPTEVGDDGTIRLDTTLVSVPVSVLDRDGRFVPFLKKADFQIFEDGTKQDIESFESVEVPFNVVLMLDTSNSTRFRLEDIQGAAYAFVGQLRPDDRVMVVSFDSQYRINCDFTSDRYELREAIYGTRPGGSTKLYEAMDMVVQRLEEMQGRKAIVIFTDGVDTSSNKRRATAESTLEMIEESGALVYPIRYDTEESVRGGASRGGTIPGIPPIINIPWPSPRRTPRNGRLPRWPFDNLIFNQVSGQFPGQWPQGRIPGTGGGDYAAGAVYLQELADRSGGRLYYAEDLRNVSSAFTQIAEELRHQYVIGYYPTNAEKDGTYRSVKVRVREAGLVVRARKGYRAVAETQARGDSDPNESQDGRPILRRRQWTGVR